MLPNSAVSVENKSAVIYARVADHGLGRECGLFAQREIRSALSVEAETVSPASVRAERTSSLVTVARKCGRGTGTVPITTGKSVGRNISDKDEGGSEDEDDDEN